MNSLFSIIGRIIIFSTLLPGVVGFALFRLIQDTFISDKFDTITFFVFVLGFLANTFGHFLEIIIRNCSKKKVNDPVGEYMLIFSKLNKEDCYYEYKNFIDYSEDLKIWYWNSATIIVLIDIAFIFYYFCDLITINLLHFTCFIISIVVSILLFYITTQIDKWTKKRMDIIEEYLQSKINNNENNS